MTDSQKSELAVMARDIRARVAKFTARLREENPSELSLPNGRATRDLSEAMREWAKHEESK